MSDSNQIARLRVAVLYGGRSTEHEISQQSAAAVVANLDPAKYEVIPISIDKQGRFHRHDLQALRAHDPRALASESSSTALTVAARPGPLFLSQGAPAIDVVFPVMHGPLCARAADRAQLEAAVLDAQRFDDKTVVEQAVDAREIEFAVLAAEDPAAPPDVSLPGEIVPRDAFYSFDRKLSYPALLDRLVRDALRRHVRRSELQRER